MPESLTFSAEFPAPTPAKPFANLAELNDVLADFVQRAAATIAQHKQIAGSYMEPLIFSQAIYQGLQLQEMIDRQMASIRDCNFRR